MNNFITKEKFRIIKFGLVGLSGVFVNLFFVWLGNNWIFLFLPETGRIPAAYALGIVLSIFSNFLLNYNWTWIDNKKHEKKSFIFTLGKYYLAAGFTALLQFILSNLLFYLTNLFFVSPARILKIFIKYTPVLIAIIVTSILNFIINHYWTFKQSQASRLKE